MFIKVCYFTDESVLCCWIVEFPAFVARRVAYKHTLLHVRAQTASFVSLDMHICSTSPDTKMRNIGLLLEPELVWGGIFDSRCGRHVPDVTRVARQSPQKQFGNFDSCNIEVILSPRTRFTHSATPFCWGWFLTVC